jgi:hypothetical protein
MTFADGDDLDWEFALALISAKAKPDNLNG